MNWKNRLTNYNFWVSIVSAVLLVLQALKIKVDFIYVNEVSTAILGLLVVIGIINDPTKSNKTSVKTSEENATKNNENVKAETETTENVEQQPVAEKEEKFLENEENEAKNAKILKNLTENATISKKLCEKENSKIVLEEQNVADENAVEQICEKEDATSKEKENKVPSNNEDALFNGNVQTDLPLAEIEPAKQTLKIVN